MRKQTIRVSSQVLLRREPIFNIISGGTLATQGTGAQNTAKIVAGCNEATNLVAAKIADAYSLYGFDDWYLPSIDELSLLYDQRVAVGNFNGDYWSSTEDLSDSALAMSLDFGNDPPNSPQFTLRTGSGFPMKVRPIRSF
jgi:hypothetical protein